MSRENVYAICLTYLIEQVSMCWPAKLFACAMALCTCAILNSAISGFARILLPAPELRCGKPIDGVTVTSQERHL
jgi:hypothetical protein